MKFQVIPCFAFVLCVNAVLGQMDCTGKPDGVHGFGCRSYTECKGGVGKIVDCSKDEAFNHVSKKCEPMDQVPPPCGKFDHDCKEKKDGKFAIKPDCLWFYTCQNGQYLGASPCNNPVNGPLVFDEKDQNCNWKYAVSKPCGTKEEAEKVEGEEEKEVEEGKKQMDCTGKPDGAYGYGCRSYTECKGGVGKIVDCSKDEAFNHVSKKCEPMDQVPPPCGKFDHDCKEKKDGKFAIKPDCLWFYTCQNGQYLGASPCNNPVDGPLVFDEKDQNCNWKYAVLKPCGTKEA